MRFAVPPGVGGNLAVCLCRQRPGQSHRHDRHQWQCHADNERFATHHHHFAERLPELAEFQHRRRRDNRLQPALRHLHRLEPHQQPKSVADIWQPPGQRHRGAAQFLRFLFRTKLVFERRRAGDLHRELRASAKRRRWLGVQRSASAQKHRQLRPDPGRQRWFGISHRRSN